MSPQNLETLRLMYEAWNRRDFDDLSQYYDSEVEFNPGILPPGEETRYIGWEGVMEWIRNVTDAWVEVTVTTGERIELAGNGVLAVDRWLFRGRDGIEIERELPTAFDFRNGLIVRVDGFTDKAEAFKAVGLQD